MKELAEVNMIAFPATAGPNFADLTQGLFRRRGPRLNEIHQVHELQTALSLVASDMGFTLLPKQVRRLQWMNVEKKPLIEDNITVTVLASRRAGENPNAIMRLTNTIHAELVDNRKRGLYP